MAQRDNKTRSLVWEEEAPAEPRFRRAQPAVPVKGRSLPGMPISMDDGDDDGPRTRSKPRKFGDEPTRPWWRPATTFGRVFFLTGVVAVLTVSAVSAYALRNFLEHDARFRIGGTSNIQATGLSQVSRAELLPIFGEDIGRNIFFVPLAERRRQLEQIPWIEHATVMRILPDQIRISVIERKPVAFLRQGSQVGLVDANGVLLVEPPAMMAQHHYSFPVVTGIDSRDAIASRRARMEVYQHLVSELDSNGQHQSDQISEIDLSDPEDARVLMPAQGTDILAHFGSDHFLERFQRYKAHIAEWRQQYPKLAEVDLRYEQQVVLQMTGGTHATPAKLDPSEVAGGSVEAPKPDPGKSDVKADRLKPLVPKHAGAAKTAKAHAPAKPSARTNALKGKGAKKKHPDPKHAVKKTAKPTAKPRPTTNATVQ
ncbi:MAG TPA: FtsQ-type POTRA domain-containing protein [Terracidiphilus sp.]|nr:FtsQ-type POTRA domain-containing protein [Terracidiphilus sp.]